MPWSELWRWSLDTVPPMLLLSAVQATVLLLIAGAATTLWRRGSAAARHYIWSAALVGTLLMPAAVALMPSRATITVRVPEVVTPTTETTTPGGSAATTSHVLSTAFSSPAEARDALNWHAIALAVWLLGAALLLARMLLNELMVRIYRARAQPLTDAAWARARDRAATRVVARPGVALLQAQRVRVPLATGRNRPAILLPASCAQWNDELRDLVLLHELSHIARLDLLAQTTAQLTRALYWFNPLVWWACARLRAEAERACDDRVLHAGVRASSYAATLLMLVRANNSTPLVAAALPMVQRAGFEGRVLAILDTHIDRSGMRRRQMVGVTLICAALVTTLSAVKPALIKAELPPLPHAEAPIASPPALTPPTPQAVALPQPAPQAAPRIQATTGDSARLVRRRPLSAAAFAITSRDGAAALLLTDNAVVLQLTDRWIDSVAAKARSADQDADFVKRLLNNPVRAGITTLLDHGIEYPLSGIGAASYENGDLFLLDRSGTPVFNNSNVNIGDAVLWFSPREARAFATRVNRAIYGASVNPTAEYNHDVEFANGQELIIAIDSIIGAREGDQVSGMVWIMIRVDADSADDVRRGEVRVGDIVIAEATFASPLMRPQAVRAYRIGWDTHETDAAGRRRFADGAHTISASVFNGRGEVLGRASQAVRVRTETR